MADQRKALSLISRRDICQRLLPLQISDTPGTGFQPAQNLSSGLVEWSCAVVKTTTSINQFVSLSIIEVRLFHDWNLDLSVLLNYFSIALPVSMLRFKCHKVEFNAVSQGKRTSQFSILASFSGVSYSGMVLRVVSSPGFLTVDFPIILAQFSDSFNLLVNF